MEKKKGGEEVVRESDEEDEDDEEERDTYKPMSRVKSLEKVSGGAGNMDLAKIKRKKFVNEKGNSGPNHRITIDLISSTNVGQSRT